MPRYYFNIRHKDVHEDDHGIELSDHKAAWVEATTACGEMMKDLDGALEIGPIWRMEVRDDQGRLIFALRFSAEMGPDFHQV